MRRSIPWNILLRQAGKKKAVPEGTAKFREETSKKDGERRGQPAATR